MRYPNFAARKKQRLLHFDKDSDAQLRGIFTTQLQTSSEAMTTRNGFSELTSTHDQNILYISFAVPSRTNRHMGNFIMRAQRYYPCPAIESKTHSKEEHVWRMDGRKNECKSSTMRNSEWLYHSLVNRENSSKSMAVPSFHSCNFPSHSSPEFG